MQPTTLMFKVGGVDMEKAVFPESFETLVHTEKGELQALAREKLPSPAGHVLLYRSTIPGIVTCNMTNVTGIDGTKAEDLTKAEFICRKQMLPIVNFLKEYVPGYENCYIKSSGTTLGVRETRRVKGDDCVTDAYVEQGLHSPDVVVHNAWFLIDIHNPAGGGQAEGFAQPAQPYDIPYGALLPAGLEGLLTAGRCISGSHRAHASYRVMAICMAMGQAAGIAAALASAQKTTPRALGAATVQQKLTQLGANLFS